MRARTRGLIVQPPAWDDFPGPRTATTAAAFAAGMACALQQAAQDQAELARIAVEAWQDYLPIAREARARRVADPSSLTWPLDLATDRRMRDHACEAQRRAQGLYREARAATGQRRDYFTGDGRAMT